MTKQEVIESNKSYIVGTDYGDGRMSDIETASSIAFDKGVEFAIGKVREAFKNYLREHNDYFCGGFYAINEEVDEFIGKINLE